MSSSSTTNADAKDSPVGQGWRPYALTFAVLAVLIVASDLATKAWTFATHHPAPEADPPRVGKTTPLLGEILEIRTAENRGIPWGMFAGEGDNVWILAIISAIACVVILWIFYWKTKSDSFLFCIGLSLILGGAAGNLYDRALLGFVRDWIHLVPDLPLVGHWPIFNIADSAICVGAGMIFLGILFTPEEEKPEKASGKSASEAAGA